jgi:hypothetical protein
MTRPIPKFVGIPQTPTLMLCRVPLAAYSSSKVKAPLCQTARKYQHDSGSSAGGMDVSNA